MCARQYTVVALLSLAAAVTPARALDLGDIQINGFVAQGYVLSSGNNVNGDSTGNGSLDFREIGVSASYRPLGDTLVAAQVASVRAGKVTDEALLLEYALVDWAPVSADWGRAGTRFGKLKLPFGLYNDSRDNVFTRPGILLPQSVYLETSGARAFGYFSLMGAQVYADWFAGDHALYAEAGFYPDQRLDESAEVPILRTTASGNFRLREAAVARLMHEYAGGRLRSALSLSTSNLRYRAGDEPPFLLDGDFAFDQAVASLQYNRERLSLTFEFVARAIELDDLIPGPASSASDQNPGGFYLQGVYRLSDLWQAMLRYDEQYRDINDRSGDKQSARSLQGLPRHYFFGRDWTVGTRYDLLPQLSLWAEFHLVDGVGWVNPLDNPDFNRGEAPRHWHFLSVMLGYRF